MSKNQPKIIQYNDEKRKHILRKVSKDVDLKDENVKKLVEELKKESVASSKQGVTTVGLSAPQIGENLNVFVFFDLAEEKYIEVINPKVIEKSKKTSEEWEGCASIGSGKTTLFGLVKRPENCKIKFLRLDGKEHEYEADNSYQSHIILHEIDHLNGILFTDRVEDKTNILTSKELEKYMKKFGRRY